MNLLSGFYAWLGQMGLSDMEKENVSGDTPYNSRRDVHRFLLAVSVCSVQRLQEGSTWWVLDKVEDKV